MSPELIRWGGLAAMLSSVMWIVRYLLALVVSDPDEALWLDALFIIGVLLTLAGVSRIARTTEKKLRAHRTSGLLHGHLVVSLRSLA